MVNKLVVGGKVSDRFLLKQKQVKWLHDAYLYLTTLHKDVSRNKVSYIPITSVNYGY